MSFKMVFRSALIFFLLSFGVAAVGAAVNFSLNSSVDFPEDI